MLQLSPNHGLNPTLAQCYICGKDTGEIILAGKLKNDAPAPKQACITKEPCDKCKEWMTKGIILIEVRSETEEGEEPYRTGNQAVIKEEAVRRSTLNEEMIEEICKKRIAFVPTAIWTAWGLPNAT